MEDQQSASPASSPLSSAESFEAEYFQQEMAQPPPAKRQKLEDGSVHATPASHEVEFDALTSISSDTSGDVPQSPSIARAFDEEEIHEQVCVCSWEGCTAGDLGNMDKLVEHIHNDHIEGRQKKYTCEWEDCTRKSMNHVSGYALRAHVRSHTREKPFYCALPASSECDRSFTRSDALAKHMRTVHETEALRPSDPIPKSMQPLIKSGTRLKLVIKQSQSQSDPQGSSPGHKTPYSEFPNLSSTTDIDQLTPLSNDIGFTPDELGHSPRELWRLLRRKVHWAVEESDALRRECEMLEAIREKEWVEKELLLDQVVKNETDWHQRREAVLATQPSADELRARALVQIDAAMAGAGANVGVSNKEEPKEAQREAAAVLASLAHA